MTKSSVSSAKTPTLMRIKVGEDTLQAITCSVKAHESMIEYRIVFPSGQMSGGIRLLQKVEAYCDTNISFQTFDEKHIFLSSAKLP